MSEAATVSVETEASGTADDSATSTVLTDVNANETNSDSDVTASDNEGTSDDNQSADDTGDEGGHASLDTYADFVMPEGVMLDEALTAEATPILKEIGATQEQAQKLMDIAAKQVQASSQKQVDTFNQLMNDWRDQSKNDGEFGGDKFEENVKIAQSAINRYGTPELKQLLEDHGVGNHPEVVRFMVRVGHTLKEDVPGSTGSTPAKASDRVSILYPNES